MAPDSPDGLSRVRPRGFRRLGHWLRLAACGVLLASGAGGCESPERPPEDTQPSSSNARRVAAEAPRIVAFGNSLTAGLGVSPDQSYPAHLQRRLHEAGYHYEVINAGVSGETTTGGLRRLSWILKSRPSIAIVELGANDALRGQPLSLMASNLSNIIEGLQKANVTVVLAGMQIPPNYGPDYTTGFASMFERLAQDHSVALIPFFLEGVAARQDLNQADGIHPTGEGYRIVADTVFDVLEPLLEKERLLSHTQ